jgi:molecular chaperone HscB
MLGLALMGSIDKVQSTIASIKEAFEADPPNLAGAKILSVQLKYWQGLEDAAREWTPKQ